MSADSHRPNNQTVAVTRGADPRLAGTEQAVELLNEELNHRIKNIFAVVSALTALSAREHPEAKAYAATLRARIAALAAAHQFVRPHVARSTSSDGHMTLHAFLRALFEPYRHEDGRPRVLISGEDDCFDDQAATSVALLFHELATNAVKYGALGSPDGRVELSTGHSGDRFLLTWVEIGGPVVTGPPPCTGFGSRLASLSVEGQLGGLLSRDWRADGLVVVADLPQAALSRRAAAARMNRR